MEGEVRRRSLVIALGLAAAVALNPVAAQASADHPGHSARHRSVVVSLGDSYIAGEAGRWKGNSADPLPGHAGTDRAYADGTVDPGRIYGATAGQCDRSDVAPIRSAHLPFAQPINLACSGARIVNVLRASSGGASFQGEPPQDDQLAVVARSHRVRLIVLSISGNDLGFGSILQACVGSYLTNLGPCNAAVQAQLTAALPVVQSGLEAALDDVRATMSQAGYRPGSYHFILQSYPSPLAPGSDFRYAGRARATVGGCPFYDADAEWFANSLVPQITTMEAKAAADRGVQFLDLKQAVAGHQLCSAEASQSTGTPVASGVEWIRFIDLAGQGSPSESLHPNFYGQAAVGRCIALAARAGRNASCAAVAGRGVWAVHLQR